MHLPAQTLSLAIVGGGPGGIAPLLAAHRAGRLDALLDGGVALIDQTSDLGSGTIGNYAINSDSTGHTFVDCLASDDETDLTRLAGHPLAQKLEAAGEGAVTLNDAGRFLGMVGDVIRGIVQRHPASRVLSRHQVMSAQRTNDGWLLQVRDLNSGEDHSLAARNILIATGAHQPAERLDSELVGGARLTDRYGSRLLQSDEALSRAGLERIADMVAGKASPRVAIIGGSTSAVSLAAALLSRMPQIRFGAGGVTLLHRRPLRIYYPTRAAALADGYTEWTEEDICPLSGRVFRFAGFRLDSRELIMAARGIAGRPAEPRLRLHQLRPDDAEALGIMDQGDVVVAAFGYRPRGLPVFDGHGNAIRLRAETGWAAPMVDDQCRVTDADGVAIPGLFGMGLAAGFLPGGRLGGEPSFHGQANGLWLWQTDVGLLIVDAVMGPQANNLGMAAGMSSVVTGKAANDDIDVLEAVYTAGD